MFAITGTPGVGKTTVSEILRKKGYRVIHLNEVAEYYGCISREGDELVVDLDCLAERFDPDEWECDFVEGHLSHHVADRCAVLRCHPAELLERMKSKNWDEDKILENLEAEIVDYILVESLEMCAEVHEIDTTGKTPHEVAGIVESIYLRQAASPPGNVDWISEIGGEIDGFIRKRL
ncbi:adenylate kinase family protein [Geoglobus acetivorans]|uniref:Putative adenylate kinase n=1 Tax=Geoglobus acetivorans TaxID=565033 RepID=A0A0A7GF99_GEOAI|nr:AMP/CMP kinase [Geoglobus acetivorans]